jgi:prevent-host-death family protein
MSLSFSEDVKPVADFERDPLKIVRQVHDTGRPVVLTVKGKADVVVVDAAFLRRGVRSRLPAPTFWKLSYHLPNSRRASARSRVVHAARLLDLTMLTVYYRE